MNDNLKSIKKLEKITDINKIIENNKIVNNNSLDFNISLKEAKKIIKEVGALNLLLLLNSLNLQPTVFYQALKDKKIFNILLSEIKELTASIKQSKDWKSKSYLIDKLELKRNKTPNNLVGLQIIVGDGTKLKEDTQVGG